MSCQDAKSFLGVFLFLKHVFLTCVSVSATAKKVKQEVQQEKDTTDEDFQFKFQSQRTPSPQHIKLKLPMSAIGGYNAATVEKKSKMQGFVGFWELNPCDLGGINLYLILSKNTHILINITCINLLQESPFK